MRTLRRLILIWILAMYLCPGASCAQTDENSMLEKARQQFSSGNYFFATTWLERILKSYPDTPHRKEILLMMAKAYDSTERNEKAVQTLQILLKDYPDAAASLDPRLLKLAGYIHPPETAAPETAASETAAPPTQTGSTGNAIPAAPPGGKPAAAPEPAPSAQKVPGHAESPGISSPPPAPVSPPAQPEPAVKTASPPPAVKPAGPAVSDITQHISLSLMSAIEMAVRKNIDLRVEALNTSLSAADSARSRSIYDPLLALSATGGESVTTGTPLFKYRNANASIGVTQYLPTGGNILASHQLTYSTFDSQYYTTQTNDWTSSLGLTLTQPLLKNAGKESMELNITLAANGRKDSLERFRFTTTDTVSSVINSYNHLYAVRQMLESRVAGLNSAQKLLDEIRKKKPGPLQGMEIANAEFAITQRRKDLVDAERNVRDQEASFRYLIGMEARWRVIPSEPPSQKETDETEEQSVRAALAFRPDLKQLNISLNSAQLQERVAKHTTLPDLSVTGGGGITGVGITTGDSYHQLVNKPSTYWSAGLQLNYPLGNTAAENDYLKSRIRTEQLQDQIKALEWKIRNDVEADMRALISARLQKQTTERALQFSVQRLVEYRKNNQLGTATVQDVINAENDFIFANNAHTDAEETFSNAVTKLWRDTGELLDRHSIHFDMSHPEKFTEGTEPAPSTFTGLAAPGT